MSKHSSDPFAFGPERSPHNKMSKSGFIARFKLLLHKDEHELMFIVRTVMELTRLCRAEATHKMWEAHHCGSSVLLITYRERAELYQEQFAERGLKVSIEPQDAKAR